jgi:hypothetical protein
MARNRKYQSAAIRFGPALKALLLCLAIGGSGVGYVWQKNQIDELGRQILKKEKQLADLQRENRKLDDLLGTLCSPPKLDQRVHELNLGLAPTQPNQVLRLDEPRLLPFVPPAIAAQNRLAVSEAALVSGLRSR